MSSLEMELDNGEENLGDDILSLSTADIQARARLMDNEVVLMTCYHFKICLVCCYSLYLLRCGL